KPYDEGDIEFEEGHEALNQQNNKTEDKFHTLLSESEDVLQEEKQDMDTNEEGHEALNQHNNKTEDKFYTMLSESEDVLQEEKRDMDTNEENHDALNQQNNKTEDKFHTMLSENEDVLQEEEQDGSFTNLKEIKPVEIEVLSKDELPLYHKKTSFKKEKKRKYYITKNNPYNRTCMKEVDDEQFFQKNTHLIDPVEKKEKTTVKIQVLLARLETDIDIVETIDLLMPLENILKVEWSIHSLDCKVVLPSKTVFLKGEFIAEIEFSNKGLENKIQSLKVSIPWSKTANINWISIPDFSYRNKNEFMFQSEHEHDPSFHYKYFQKFAEPIRSQLKQINFVWHQQLNSKDQQLQVNGVAQLSIHFMQEQFVDLECYSKKY
nr:hypothetical protein [Lactobacillus sp.]